MEKFQKKVSLKAFEIFIHATQYNTEDAFGCSKCPDELLEGESEDDYETIREVHISDNDSVSSFLTILCQHF